MQILLLFYPAACAVFELGQQSNESRQCVAIEIASREAELNSTCSGINMTDINVRRAMVK